LTAINVNPEESIRYKSNQIGSLKEIDQRL